jgi:hypothetical protein
MSTTHYEPVFEMNHWILYRHADGVSLKHRCQHHMGRRKMNIAEVFVYPYENQACWRCTEAIPEGIAALSLLYNWDDYEEKACW